MCAQEGLVEIGLEFYVKDPKARLPTVTTIKARTGVVSAVVIHFSLVSAISLLRGGRAGHTAAGAGGGRVG